MHDNTKKGRVLIDAAVSGDSGVIKKGAEHILKTSHSKYSACGM